MTNLKKISGPLYVATRCVHIHVPESKLFDHVYDFKVTKSLKNIQDMYWFKHFCQYKFTRFS